MDANYLFKRIVKNLIEIERLNFTHYLDLNEQLDAAYLPCDKSVLERRLTRLNRQVNKTLDMLREAT